MRISGIYKIQSVIKPERIYIGSAIYIKSRWAMHLYELRNNKHVSQKLQRHYNKYGESDLQFSILSGCEKERLIEQEQFYIDAYKPYFNNRIIAASNLGLSGRWHHSEEWKRKTSERGKGRHPSPETRAMLSFIAKNRPPELKKLFIGCRKGSKMSDETKLKLSITSKGNKNCLGYKHTKEALQKMREANLGKKLSKEHIKKLIASNKGRVATLETRKKISEALKGKKRSIESRINISNGHKGNIPSIETRMRLSESGKKAWILRKTYRKAV